MSDEQLIKVVLRWIICRQEPSQTDYEARETAYNTGYMDGLFCKHWGPFSNVFFEKHRDEPDFAQRLTDTGYIWQLTDKGRSFAISILAISN